MAAFSRHDVLAISRKSDGGQRFPGRVDDVALPVLSRIEQHDRTSVGKAAAAAGAEIKEKTGWRVIMMIWP